MRRQRGGLASLPFEMGVSFIYSSLSVTFQVSASFKLFSSVYLFAALLYFYVSSF